MAFHITIRQDKSEQVRVHGLIAVAAGKQLAGFLVSIYWRRLLFTCNICTFVCVYIYMCTYCLHIHLHLSIARDGHTVWFQIVMVTDGDAASCASRRCYTFALHQSHGIPMPKKVTSNRNLEQWFGSAMITVGHWETRFNQRAITLVSAIF